MNIVFKGKIIKGQRLDLLVFGEVVVEIKSVRKMEDVFTAQVLSYLKSTKLKRGLLINFGETRLVDGIKRIAIVLLKNILAVRSPPDKIINLLQRFKRLKRLIDDHAVPAIQ